MSKAKSYIPEGKQTVTPHLILSDVSKAIEFYKKAFGAQELMRMPMPNGKIMHACLQIGNSQVMFADEMPGGDCVSMSPQTLKGCHASLHVYVENVDEVYRRACEAGATPQMPPQDMFWGDRYGMLVDPFGQMWSLATHVEDLTPEQMKERAKECAQKMASAAPK